MKTKKGFTLIELMIVVAIMAILAMIAVSQYIGYVQKSRASATQSLLQNLYLAELTYKVLPGASNEVLPIIDDGSTSLSNIQALAEHGFRPDPQIAFSATPFPGPSTGENFVLFAAFYAQEAQVFVFNFIPRAGVRPFDPSADYAAIAPAELFVYSFESGTATPIAKAGIDLTRGVVTSLD